MEMFIYSIFEYSANLNEEYFEEFVGVNELVYLLNELI
jgi:hypothetical protein